MADQKWLRYAEAAAEYPPSESTFRRLVLAGELSITRVGGSVFLDRDEIDQLFERNRQRAA